MCEAPNSSESQGNRQAELTRREFVRLAMMASALPLGSTLPLAAEGPADGSLPYFGALRPLPPGAVRPEGWLRGYLQKQAAELGSNLPEVAWPFTRAYWAEEQEAETWWPWEQKAYWIDGATRLGILLRDDKLLAKAGVPLQYTLAHIDTAGYIGPEFFRAPNEDYHRWPHNVFFRALSATADGPELPAGITSDQIVSAMHRHYLADPAPYGTPIRNVTNVENMMWVYEKTGDKELVEKAEKAWREYLTVAADPYRGDLATIRVLQDTPINAHGETYAETAKQPAILYMYTGKEEYLQFALAAQRRIFDHHMLIDGIPSTSEFFRTTTSLDSHETCDISDHTWSWGYLLMATGDAVWADRVERACFNAAPGAIKNDWKAVQYFSCPNQFLATLNSDHNDAEFKERGGRMMAYQPNPGQKTACCGGNVHRIFPNYVIRMWMKSNDGGLAAVMYGPSTLNTTIGPNRQPIQITQTTHYPFDEQVKLTIQSSRAVSFPLSLRVPRWCDNPRLTLNGVAVPVTRTTRGFVMLQRTFQPGDVVTLTLPMKLALTRWPQEGIALERGPLVYSLPIKEIWTTKVEPKFTTAEFPSWEARPGSPWNYGLALNEANLEREVTVEKTPLPPDHLPDPWENTPITLHLPARRIADWELQSNPDNPDQKFTPCLPDVADRGAGAIERISLVPYGSTQLRVTIFPALRD
jgi:hypothetical protein